MRIVGALTRLSERKLLRTGTPPIVVCIPCAEGAILPGISRRHMEYGDYNHPVSQAYGEFVATKLHPYVKESFRVMDVPEHTSTIGCSLGGQASLQLILRYPNIFGGAACLSPCFQPGTIAAVTASLVTTTEIAASIGGILRVFPKANESLASGLGYGDGETDTTDLRSKTIYLDNGGDADNTRVPIFDVHDHFTMNDKFWNPGYWWLDTNLQPMIDAMRFVFDQAGVKYTYERFPGGRHNERAWAQRIHHP
jgi:enterochelin esterase-like enzyme